MDQELQKRLASIEERLEENHRILVKIRRTQRNATLFRVGYWILIILIGLGAFYFIRPFMEQIGQAYGVGSGENADTFNSLMEQFGAIQQE